MDPWNSHIEICDFDYGEQEWSCYVTYVMGVATQNYTTQPITLRPVSLLFYQCAEGQIGAMGTMMCK